MPAGNAADRRDFDIPASQAAQDHFNADGASEQYAAKEQRWHNVADEVRGIIQVLRGSLGSNDETAAHSLQRAKTAVDNIG
jgi:hypothetical protein